MKECNSHLLPVTVIIPVRNEERNIKKCLLELGAFSQVIVVDSSSTDGTRQIVLESGHDYIDFDWNGSFPKKRNWTLENYNIKNEWVLFLDADEFVCDRFIQEIDDAISGGGFDAFWLSYKNYFMGKEQKFGLPMRKIALFKASYRYERIDEFNWSELDMEVHEHPVIKGSVGHISTKVEHNDYKGIKHYLDRHSNYAVWEAMRYLNLDLENKQVLTVRQRLKYYFLKSVFSGTFFFFYIYFLRLGFLDGISGYYFARFKAAYYLTIGAHIREFKKKEL